MQSKIDVLAAEVLERAIRIGLLVKLSTRRLAISFQKDTAQIAAANQIHGLLKKLVIGPIIDIYSNTGNKSEEQRLDVVRSLLETVAAIHEGALPTVPRVIEPIELRSYLRQSREGPPQKPPLVFASERLGIQVYPNSLAGLLSRIATKQKLMAEARHDNKKLRELAVEALSGNTSDVIEDELSANQHAYVAIPAVDIHNPNRWPSLWHELAHHKLQEEKTVLIDAFRKHINGDDPQATDFDDLCIEIAPLALDDIDEPPSTTEERKKRQEEGLRLIEKWLMECWCDAYGVKQAGLAFLYSQLHDFMFCFDSYLGQRFRLGQHYPPAEFRLSIARNFALERLKHSAGSNPPNKLVANAIENYLSEERLFKDIVDCPDGYADADAYISLLFSSFNSFLKSRNSHVVFNPSETISGDISPEIFETLEDDLKKGLPIPYVEVPAGSRATHVSEILLAGWGNRNSVLREEIIKQIKDASKVPGERVHIESLIRNVSALIERSDESIKRSVQVAEWFSILHQSSPDDAKQTKPDPAEIASASSTPAQTQPIEESEHAVPTGLLCDDDIIALLKKPRADEGKLNVIPLIDFAQVSGSAIDLRLGHNFEIFQPLFESAIDACGDEASARQDSLQVEVDFLHGLPVLPGQFILGHTLEYIKLPKDVAAQIEGRSSFARLGIQVHMTANLVEAGFDGCLTLEIHNNGPATVMLYPGMRIAQLRLFKLGTRPSEPYGRLGNKYRGQLSHNKAKQISDREVAVFIKERRDRKIAP